MDGVPVSSSEDPRHPSFVGQCSSSTICGRYSLSCRAREEQPLLHLIGGVWHCRSFGNPTCARLMLEECENQLAFRTGPGMQTLAPNVDPGLATALGF